MSIHAYYSKALLIILSCWSLSAQGSARIEPQADDGSISVAIVEQQMDDLVAQAAKRNANGMLKHYSRDVKIELTMTMMGQEVNESLNYEKLAENLHSTFSQLENYSFDIVEHHITLLSDDTAKVDFVSVEALETGTMTITIRSSGTSHVRMENGSPKLFKVIAKANAEAQQKI